MKKSMDTIQFESRAEVGELIKVLEKYVDAYPKEKDNPTVKKLYNLLDVMEMEW
jgi:transcriptional regulator with XRE-family HTH domain